MTSFRLAVPAACSWAQAKVSKFYSIPSGLGSQTENNKEQGQGQGHESFGFTMDEFQECRED